MLSLHLDLRFWLHDLHRLTQTIRWADHGSNMAFSFSLCRSKMRSYEYSRSTHSQGIYMKHLLKHMATPDLSICSMLEEVAESVSKEEHPSLTMRMKPEYRY